MPSRIDARGTPEDSDSRPRREISFAPEIIEVPVGKPAKIMSPRGTDNTLETPQARGTKDRGTTRSTEAPPRVTAVSTLPKLNSSSISAKQIDKLDNLEMREDLIKFVPPQSVINALQTRGIRIQYLEDAMGNLNIDYYPVKITKMPVVNGQVWTPERLLEHIRLNFNDFIKTRYSDFEPLDKTIDFHKWQSRNPLGTVLKIDLLLTDNAAVVVSAFGRGFWRFTTVKTSRWKPGQTGTHPVSGNREFGIKSEGNNYIFYTRGADRATEIVERIFAGIMTFPIADFLWSSLQEGVTNFINQHGGQAQIVLPISRRVPWDEVKLQLNKRKR